MDDRIDIGFALADMTTDEAVAALNKHVAGMRDRQRLELEVPDLDSAVTRYRRGDAGIEDALLRNGKTRSLWNKVKIERLLDACGLLAVDVSVTEHGTLRAAAIKYPLPEPVLPMKKIRAIMSLPRVTWTTTASVLHEACMHLGIECSRSTGVFWGQCLERMIEQCVKDGMEYILTVDYDSVFDHTDIVRLWQVMEANPDIAALCPAQIQRDKCNTLCSIRNDDGEPVTNVSIEMLQTDAVDINSGHFGLTLIRVSSLRGIKRPLFHSVPDAEGSWGDGRTDEDITFWLRLKDAGRRVCLCPRVRIGHLQLVITWPNDDFSAVHQYYPDFIDHGRPAYSRPK